MVVLVSLRPYTKVQDAAPESLSPPTTTRVKQAVPSPGVRWVWVTAGSPRRGRHKWQQVSYPFPPSPSEGWGHGWWRPRGAWGSCPSCPLAKTISDSAPSSWYAHSPFYVTRAVHVFSSFNMYFQAFKLEIQTFGNWKIMCIALFTHSQGGQNLKVK